ncbi:MAG: hypothetical protein ABMB14_37595, partial [Myxococcota bacterium]
MPAKRADRRAQLRPLRPGTFQQHYFVFGEEDEVAVRVPYRKAGLTLTSGFVTAETPISGTLALSIDLRPKRGLRVDAFAESWLGTAYLPRADHVVGIAIPSIGVGAVFESPTSTPTRFWLGGA